MNRPYPRPHHRRRALRQRGAPVNLVSLMDIFTLLVFFLLTHSAIDETIPGGTSVTLPESVSQQTRRHGIWITVDRDVLSVQGEPVIRLDRLDPGRPTIPALDQALRRHAGQDGITLAGDRSLPYAVLKKIVATCQAAGFRRISLAVTMRPPSGGGGSPA